MFRLAGCLILITNMPNLGLLAFSLNSAILRNLFFRMKPNFRPLALSAILLTFAAATPALPAKSDAEQIAVSVGRLLEEGHYTHQHNKNDKYDKN